MRRPPVRVVSPAGEGATPSVSVGDFQSDADADADAREREETKRLFYVALTRARDRVYLGSVLKEGRLQPGRGSLAEVVPSTLAELFNEANARPGAAVSWRAASRRVHRFPVCGADSSTATLRASSGTTEPIERLDDFEPIHIRHAESTSCRRDQPSTGPRHERVPSRIDSWNR